MTEYHNGDLQLIEVEVESARNVPLGAKEAIAKSAGTYVSLRMTPAQEGVGEQTEYTSIATRVVNPRWSPPGPPPRRAHGATEAIGAGAAAPSGYRPGDVVIGEGFVDLLGVFPVHNGTYTPGRHKGNSRRVAVPIREPMGKRRTKCSVMLGLRCRRVNETIDTHEDRLYEYQRWTRLAGWSTAGKPRVGKWSTVDGTVFSDDFAEVAPPAREDSEVVLPWCPFGGWEYSREDETTPPAIARNTPNRDEVRPSKGPEDWENFTVGRKGAVWMEGHVSGYDSVRRRLWRRVYLDRGSSSVGLSAMTT
eukprot:jgi/Undpi1/5525/HiC_scaffold_2.g00803.m1